MAENNERFNCYGAIAEAIDKELNRFLSPDTWANKCTLSDGETQAKGALLNMCAQAEFIRLYVNTYIDNKIALAKSLSNMSVYQYDFGKIYSDVENGFITSASQFLNKESKENAETKIKNVLIEQLDIIKEASAIGSIEELPALSNALCEIVDRLKEF